MRSKDKKLVEVAKDYVRKHYHEKITLENIAAVTYLNPNYFSEMFKNQTGENFIDYLTRYRMERAKELLKDVRMKTYQVSHRVGYDNADYFCKVFKKVVGVPPGQYRDLD
jgi:two-component system response regulator YesN